MGIIRDSFVIFASWDNAIRVAPDDVQLELYHAVMDWAKTGAKPDGLSWQAEMLMKSIERDMEGNIAKYNAAVENGKRGGNPNFKKGQSNPYYNSEKITEDNLNNLDNPDITEDNQKITQDNPDITQHNLDITKDNRDITLYDNDNVYVYVNKLVKENKNNKLINQVRTHAYTHESLISYLKEKFNLLYSFYPSHSSDIDFLLNEMAGLIAEADTGPLKFNNHSFTGEEMAAIIDEISVDELPGLVNSLIHNSGLKNKTLYILGGLLNILNEKIKKGG